MLLKMTVYLLNQIMRRDNLAVTIDSNSIRITDDYNTGEDITVKPLEFSTLFHATDAIDSMRYEMEELKKLIKEKESDNMNDVLELYKSRREKEIRNKYKDIIDKEYNEQPAVKEWHELTTNFEIEMKQLAEKYNTEDLTCIIKTGYVNDYEYALSNRIRDDIKKEWQADLDEELGDLYKFVEEVNAVLSISDDKDYKIEVLKNYEILDKKGKLSI